MRKELSTYIILLRAVNVSGKNIIQMVELRKQLTDVGFQQVRTYIQSGNILLASSEAADVIQRKVKELILHRFDLTVEVFVMTTQLLEKALTGMPIRGTLAPNRLFITLLNETPDNALVDKLQAIDHGTEIFALVDNILYFYLPDGAANAKMSNNYFEKKLRVIGTGRNLNTYQKLLELTKNSS